VEHLACANQFAHRTSHILDRHVGIDAVLIQQIDPIGPQPPQRCLDHFTNVLGTAVHAVLHALWADPESELGGDHHLVAHRHQSLTHQLFVGERPIHLGGVEQRHPTLRGGTQQRYHLAPVSWGAISVAHSHATETERRDAWSVGAECPILHCERSPCDSANDRVGRRQLGRIQKQ
jgi:hypothetical protein